jgi:hypothetical protein
MQTAIQKIEIKQITQLVMFRTRHERQPHLRAEKVTAIPISDAPHASFIYFENAPAFGFANGVVNITLSANRTYAGPDGAVVNEQVVVAYLRGNIPAGATVAFSRTTLSASDSFAASAGQARTQWR